MQLTTKELVENADLRNSIMDMVIAEMGPMAGAGGSAAGGVEARFWRPGRSCARRSAQFC